MRDGIKLYLKPVLDDLHRLDGQLAGAHDDIAAAHDSNAAGWFGSGDQGADVYAACNSFLNEMALQLQQLVQDHKDLTESLSDYDQALENHIKWAEKNEEEITHHLTSIHHNLENRGN